MFNKTTISRRAIKSRSYNSRRRILMEQKIDYWLSVKRGVAVGAAEKIICQMIADRYTKRLLYYIKKDGE